jgi:hypothetical protein
MPSLLLRRRTVATVTAHLQQNPDQLERYVRSKWLFVRSLPRRARQVNGAPVYVSLTSYPARFGTLATTLKCLLMQTFQPEAVLLWIAEDDMARLPHDVLRLTHYGLQIRTCPDLRSYKKIIPALRWSPDAFLVTADDDCYYSSRWLAQMVGAWTPYSREVICHRAHRIRLDSEGQPLPYMSWDLELRTESAHPLNFMTGVGGVLYPPGSLPAEVLDEHLFQKLCAGCDDVWLWWMLRKNGYWVRKIRGPWPLIHWSQSQLSSLYQENVLEHGNDLAISAMVRHFGFPSNRSVHSTA